MPRSQLLDRAMKEGSWTNERVHRQLPGVSFTYFEQVMAGNKRPSFALAAAIRNIVASTAKVREIFPDVISVKESLSASSIDGSADSYNMPPGQTGTGSNHIPDPMVARNFPAENIQS